MLLLFRLILIHDRVYFFVVLRVENFISYYIYFVSIRVDFAVWTGETSSFFYYQKCYYKWRTVFKKRLTKKLTPVAIVAFLSVETKPPLSAFLDKYNLCVGVSGTKHILYTQNCRNFFDMKCILGPFWLKRILKQCVF